MKKVLSILALYFLFSGSTYSEETKTFEEFSEEKKGFTLEELFKNSDDIKIPKEWGAETGYDAKKIGTAPINRLLKNGWKVIGVTSRSGLPVYHLIKKNELIFCIPRKSGIKAICFKP